MNKSEILKNWELFVVQVRIGKLPDGRITSVRNKNGDTQPILEIYDKVTGEAIKIRYGKR